MAAKRNSVADSVVDAAAAAAAAVADRTRNGKPSPPPAPPAAGGRGYTPPPAYTPFPVDLLPPVVRELVQEGAADMGVDAAVIALPALAACGGMVGVTRCVMLKKKWREYPVIWGAVVAESGTVKSSGLELALEPVEELTKRIHRDHARQMAEYAEARKSNPEAVKPEPPRVLRVEDATVEAVCELLARNPRGLLLAFDELSGWFRSFDKYSGKGDTSQWLKVFGGRSLTVHRRTGECRSIYVPHAAVSITGTIQLALLEKLLTDEHRESGLAARFLFCYPPERCKRWSDAEVDPQTTRRYSDLLSWLNSLEFADAEQSPVVVPLAPDAQEEYIAFVNEWGVQTYGSGSDRKKRLAKLEAYAARFALVDHLCRCHLDDDLRFHGVGLESIRNGIGLAKWFAAEGDRLEAAAGGTVEDRDRNRLVAWLERRGGRATVRDLQRSSGRRYGNAEDARYGLSELARLGLATWEGPVLVLLDPVRQSDTSDETDT